MPRNVEIKARVDDPGEVRRRAEAVADRGPFELEQEDVFFDAPAGRLKLRRFGDGKGELIWYRRPDDAGPKTCRYSVVPVAEPGALVELLSRALGVRGIVRKRRRLYLCGQTRIHLDRVEGLGDFLELEVVLRGDQEEADGRRTAERLMRELAVSRDALVEAAYVDLLAAGAG